MLLPPGVCQEDRYQCKGTWKELHSTDFNECNLKLYMPEPKPEDSFGDEKCGTVFRRNTF